MHKPRTWARISYNSAISACEKGQQWKQALSSLLEMWTSQQTPDVISYNSAISACETGQQSEQALSLRLEMWTSLLALRCGAAAEHGRARERSSCSRSSRMSKESSSSASAPGVWSTCARPPCSIRTTLP